MSSCPSNPDDELKLGTIEMTDELKAAIVKDLREREVRKEIREKLTDFAQTLFLSSNERLGQLFDSAFKVDRKKLVIEEMMKLIEELKKT